MRFGKHRQRCNYLKTLMKRQTKTKGWMKERGIGIGIGIGIALAMQVQKAWLMRCGVWDLLIRPSHFLGDTTTCVHSETNGSFHILSFQCHRTNSSTVLVDIILFKLFKIRPLGRSFLVPLISQFIPLGGPTSSLTHYSELSPDTICNSSSPPIADIVLFGFSLLSFYSRF